MLVVKCWKCWWCSKVHGSWNNAMPIFSLDPDLREISGGRVAEPHAFPWYLMIPGLIPPQDCPNVQAEQKWTWQPLLQLWWHSHHQSARSHCLSLCGWERKWMCRKRLFKRWGGSFIFVLRLPHISGDHYVIVGRNSLKTVLDKKDESLYKIPIIGLFGTSPDQNKGF